jgi:type I restriction enzyme M protein
MTAMQSPHIEPSISVIPAGQLRDYVHDVLRKETLEEHVRQGIARSLVEEYGYSKSQLHVDFPIKVGSGRRRRIDIAIFPEGVDHKQETVFAIVETKRDGISPHDQTEGIEQLMSYMAACINARWGLWIGSEMQAYEKVDDPRESFRVTPDIPFKGERESRRLQFSELVPATERLRDVFSRCYNYLQANANVSQQGALYELLKLIFCKVYDEQKVAGDLEFSITQEERSNQIAQRKLRQRIEKLFQNVKVHYPHIFEPSERIELDNRSLAYIVGELQKFNFLETSSDITASAYEEIVSVISSLGQGVFFTPRNVCDMAVSMVFSTYPSSGRLMLRILDPACGTGGFLRAVQVLFRDIIKTQVTAKWVSDRDRIREDVARQLRRVCKTYIYGIDKLPELVRATQINLAVNGDGSSNVYQVNSLLHFSEMPMSVQEEISPGSFDVVLTNPPFGSRLSINDPHILDQFELARFEARAIRSSMPSEQIFIERCLDFLKPRGRMAIVLPDGIVSNPRLAFVRKWLLTRAYVIASVDLPRETFVKSGVHTMTSVLVLQKFTDTERRLAEENRLPDYQTFMAVADYVGWDHRGSPIYQLTPEGEKILQRRLRVIQIRTVSGAVAEETKEEEIPVVNDQLPVIGTIFSDWLASLPVQEWQR